MEEGWMKLTQPVLLQSFTDEFELPTQKAMTPAVPGDVLQKSGDEPGMDAESQTKYRSGVGKLLHMMRWSRPEILNAVRELSRFGGIADPAHMKALMRTMKYCSATPNRGLLLKPDCKWDGNKDFQFTINARSDSEFMKDAMTRKSVGGHVVYLNGAPVCLASKMQRIVALSVTEAELIQCVECAQDMLYVMHVLEDLGLKVSKPMILECDNQGAVNIANNWSSMG